MILPQKASIRLFKCSTSMLTIIAKSVSLRVVRTANLCLTVYVKFNALDYEVSNLGILTHNSLYVALCYLLKSQTRYLRLVLVFDVTRQHLIILLVCNNCNAVFILQLPNIFDILTTTVGLYRNKFFIKNFFLHNIRNIMQLNDKKQCYKPNNN